VSFAQVSALAGSGFIRPGRGLGGIGSFIVRAAIWHIVGRAIFTIFRAYPFLGSVAAVLLVVGLVYLLMRWLSRRRLRQRAYGRTWQGPRDW
jgi:hypothetical protein